MNPPGTVFVSPTHLPRLVSTIVETIGLQSSMRVLILGSALVEIAACIEKKSEDVANLTAIGVSKDKKVIQRGWKKAGAWGPNYTFYEGNIGELHVTPGPVPIPTNSFDVIVVHHFNRWEMEALNEQVELLRHWQTYLNPTGRIIATAAPRAHSSWDESMFEGVAGTYSTLTLSKKIVTDPLSLYRYHHENPVGRHP